MDWLFNPEIWIALITLTILEIVLGVDNIIFISILSAKLPARQQRPARRLGLALAMFVRIGLLLSISWIIRLTEPLFAVAGHDFSGRDLTLLVGGLFLLAKSTYEIHDCLEGDEGHRSAQVTASFASVLLQILALDVVFSLDSVITAVGMVEQVGVMVAAIVIAVGVMLLSAEAISGSIEDLVPLAAGAGEAGESIESLGSALLKAREQGAAVVFLVAGRVHAPPRARP